LEELDLENLLKTLKNFDRGEQIILGNFGTVQTLLSLIFGHPVTMKLIYQYEKEEVVIRRVQLMVKDNVLCHAVSSIPKLRNRDDVISDISKGQMGLGQIIAHHRLSSRRSLIRVGEDDEFFWRTYNIEGPEVYFQITESFVKEPFEAIGWIRSLSKVGAAWNK
jgi:chorismate-pyruvate lyase